MAITREQFDTIINGLDCPWALLDKTVFIFGQNNEEKTQYGQGFFFRQGGTLETRFYRGENISFVDCENGLLILDNSKEMPRIAKNSTTI